ncbi:MAG: helicase-associated domain-containing protein [Anaerolineales bacterium]|jgi:hypothetical protein
MPSLLRFFEDRDLGYLRIVAELAGLELPDAPRAQMAAWLAEALTQPETLEAGLDALSAASQEAMNDLLQHAGQVPFADFSRQFGPMRDIGPARRDRELLWRSPVSPLEELWYRGYVGRAFLDTPSGPQEFVYIPDEIFAALGAPSAAPEPMMGRPAASPEHAQPATSALVDDATTLLAALRRRTENDPLPSRPLREHERSHLHFPQAVPLLMELLQELRILDRDSGLPRPEATREFLQSGRPEALRKLLLAWRDSSGWNDLSAVDHLRSTSDGWPNDPLRSRKAMLVFLSAIPPGTWWDLDSFLQDIQREHPGFQRPAADFDSWYLQDDEGNILHGINAWSWVDGAMLLGTIEHTLHWLGAVDLGMDRGRSGTTAFRLTPASPLLFDRPAEIEIQAPPGEIEISGRGVLRFARSAARTLRYQIARFADWGPADEANYEYLLTSDALRRASDQGLEVHHIQSLLEETTAQIPPSLIRALERYSRSGLEARIESVYLLRTETPGVMEELRTNRATSRYIKELIGPKTALIEKGQAPRLVEAALRVGLLLDSFSLNAAEDEK